jgi:hypothetical protein
MDKNKIPAPPHEGIVYGEITHWLLLVGVLIAIIGLVIYIASPGYIDKTYLLNHLWAGDDSHTILSGATGSAEPPHWYSCFGLLPRGDMLATLGIAVTCLAAVIGMWGTAFQMIRNKGRLYLIFALIIAAVLTLSALGIVKLGD